MALREFIGKARTRREVELIEFTTGTPAQYDRMDLTEGGATISVEMVGSAPTKENMVDALVALVNGDSSTSTVHHFLTKHGKQVGQFFGMEAKKIGTEDVRIYGGADGRPMNLTFAISGGGSQLHTKTTPVTGTGPAHYDEADNWSGAAVPGLGDDVVFSGLAQGPLLYALNQSSVNVNDIHLRAGMIYPVGLFRINLDNAATPFSEHLERYLRLDSSTGLYAGRGGGNGCPMANFDISSAVDPIEIRATGARAVADWPAFVFKGTTGTTPLNIEGCGPWDIGVAIERGDAANISSIDAPPIGPSTPLRLQMGAGVTGVPARFE